LSFTDIPAGSYPIVVTVGTLTSINHSFKLVNGSLVITANSSTPSCTATEKPGNKPGLSATRRFFGLIYASSG
jgi:hypothetical protein